MARIWSQYAQSDFVRYIGSIMEGRSLKDIKFALSLYLHYNQSTWCAIQLTDIWKELPIEQVVAKIVDCMKDTAPHESMGLMLQRKRFSLYRDKFGQISDHFTEYIYNNWEKDDLHNGLVSSGKIYCLQCGCDLFKCVQLTFSSPCDLRRQQHQFCGISDLISVINDIWTIITSAQRWNKIANAATATRRPISNI